MSEHPPRFLVSLDEEDHQRLQRLLGALAERLGRVPSPDGVRYAGSPDLIGAALTVAERDPRVFDAVSTEIRRTTLRRAARSELLAICDELDRIALRLEDPEHRHEIQGLVRTLRELAVAVAVQDEPVGLARNLLREAHRLARLAERGGPWSQPLQDLAGSLDDLHDALRPTGPGGSGAPPG
ncbi:hypothetical protein [Actinomycetospora sp.]|jgi:hypothetical protein|uniref:hypothetical protein n=1 Tax=Actinomycetospora sp. TaxID=1872135 RepID=UPI002F3F990B